MASDRVLIEIDTIARMAGVTEANAGFGNMLGAVTAVGVGLLGLVAIGKNVIDITDAHTKAENNLAQAVGTTKLSLKDQRDQITTFMQTNRDYISNQADVINSYAQLIRTGLDQTQVQRVMNDAIDLASLKGISYTDAVNALSNAEFGRMRGLIDLGITTAKYTDANGNLVASQHSVAQSMAEIDARVKGGRGTLTDLARATNDLSMSWQDLAIKEGPALEAALASLMKFVADKVVPGFQVIIDQLGHALPEAIKQIAGPDTGHGPAGGQIRATQAKYAKTGQWDDSANLQQWDPLWTPLAGQGGSASTGGRQGGAQTDGGALSYATGQGGTTAIVNELKNNQTENQKQTALLKEQRDLLYKTTQQNYPINLSITVDPNAESKHVALIIQKAMQV